jgi:hypothetical protein
VFDLESGVWVLKIGFFGHFPRKVDTWRDVDKILDQVESGLQCSLQIVPRVLDADENILFAARGLELSIFLGENVRMGDDFHASGRVKDGWQTAGMIIMAVTQDNRFDVRQIDS